MSWPGDRKRDYAKLVVSVPLAICGLAILGPMWAAEYLNQQRRRWRIKRREKHRRAELERQFLKPRTRPNTLSTRPGVVSTRPGATGPLFTLLPPEIRRRILIEAFGDRTLHLDFSYLKARTGEAPRPARWAWYSSVCCSDEPGLHHYQRRHAEGRRRTCQAFPAPREYIERPRNPSQCPRSDGSGGEREPCLDDYSVGAAGWLLTCRQANKEGLEVLYGTNTIHLDTRVLLQGLQDMLAPEKLALIRSLELNVSQNNSIWSYFKGLSEDSRRGSKEDVLFPSLRRLRFVTDGRDDIYQKAVDELMERIAPRGAECIVSPEDAHIWPIDDPDESAQLVS